MKYWIIGVMIVAVVGSAYWAGTKHEDSNDAEVTSTPSSIAVTNTTSPIVTVQSTPAYTNTGGSGAVVGNKVGNIAPDFRLKDTSGRDVSLRDYRGQEVRIEFTESGKLRLQGNILLDPGDVVHRLYAVTSMPYTVNIDINGIIR